MGCNKTKIDTQKNHLKIGEVEYDLSFGYAYVSDKHEEDQGYSYEFGLYSKDFTFHESDGILDSISGKGHGILFALYSSQADKLDIGSYKYDAIATKKSGTFDECIAVIDYDIVKEGGTMLDIYSGLF